MTIDVSIRTLSPFRVLASFLLVCFSLCGQAASQGSEAAPAGLPPTGVFFAKFFTPDTIGPGSVSTLTFEIDSELEQPVTDLAFTDTLPAALTIAAPAAVSNSCGGTVTAPDGGGTITLSGGVIAASGTCEITVDVTGTTSGDHQNVSGDLTSSAGNSGPAVATLTIDAGRPGFSKAFDPATVQLGARSTLTFAIDNTANADQVFGLTFTDDLPGGLVLAEPADPEVTCDGGMLTATPGTGVISYGPDVPLSASVAAGDSCSISVDVVAGAIGSLGNTSRELISQNFQNPVAVSSGKAAAVLEVTADELHLIKEFTDDPVPPGDPVTLEFTVANQSRTEALTDIGFSDDLDAALSGLVAVGTPLPDPCGAGSTLSGTSSLSLTGGSLAPEESCTFSIDLQVPAAAPPGSYPNTTSQVTGQGSGGPVTGNAASDRLFVQSAPVLTKTFIDDPVTGGDTVTLEFAITNTSFTSDATDIQFADNLDDALPGLTADTLPPDGFCGTGSTMTGTSTLMMSGGSLAPGENCVFQVTLQLPADAPGRPHLNRTSEITATVDEETVTGNSATDTLEVVSAPLLSKDFTDDPVVAGDTVTLEFTLTNGSEAGGDATGIAFTDDLEATLSGLAAVGLPQNDVCGAGSSISGTSNLSFTGGALAPGESCTISVTLQVPAGAAPGSYPNTTSGVSAMVDGVAVTSAAAGDELVVASLFLSKEFTDDPAIPGGTVTLQFTIENVGADDATGISFIDDLDAVLSGLSATGLPATDVCGAGSSLSGSSLLTFTGGTLAAGTSCTFSVTLSVPAAAVDGTYPNTTSGFSATVGGEQVSPANAVDNLTVIANPLQLTKEFTGDPAGPGDTVTLQFTLTNLAAENAVSDIAFSDDLDAALPGLMAVSLPDAGAACNGTGTLDGTTVLSFTGGALAPGGSCSFAAELLIPDDGLPGISVTNTTSQVSGTIDGAPVTGDPASDDLSLLVIAFGKAFDSPVAAGGAATLQFTLENLGNEPVTALSFTDDLNAVLPGLVATGLPLTEICGPISELSGDSILTFRNGSLDAGASCSFEVTLQVPVDAAPGSFLNTTSIVTIDGQQVGAAASSPLGVEPPPLFSKSFSPAAIGLAQTSTLTFTIDNAASALAAAALDFTDNLPAGVVIATPSGATTTCTGGTLTAVDGGGSIAYTGGSVAAGAGCTVSVDVQGDAAGTHVNTSGDLTSSLGNSGTATDTLTVNPAPGFTKAFSPDTINLGEVSTLTFTIDNSASTLAAIDLDFFDSLPAGVVLATPPGATTTCTGGTLDAPDGGSSITYTGGSVAAGASCTVAVDVLGDLAGTHVNTSGDLTSSLGNSGTASDTLTVIAPQAPVFTKAFSPDTINVGDVSTLTFAIDNSASAVAAVDLDFIDNLPAGVVIAAPSGAATTCTGGTLAAPDGGGSITYTGGSVAAGASCTVAVDVRGNDAGTHVNTSGDLTSSLGNSGTATDMLTVNAAPEFTKSFSPDTINPGEVSTLIFTIDNTGSTVPAEGLGFSDEFPEGLRVADPANDSTTCSGGTLTAPAGGTMISYSGGSVGPGASCTVTVDVTADTPGSFTNVAGDLTSGLGNSGPATAPIEVMGDAAISVPALSEQGLLLLLTLLAGAGLLILRPSRR